jgi:hypothetical protein
MEERFGRTAMKERYMAEAHSPQQYPGSQDTFYDTNLRVPLNEVSQRLSSLSFP